MDPATMMDWEAEAFCDVCDKDTGHYFSAPCGAKGRWAVTYLTCEACGRETELSPEDFED